MSCYATGVVQLYAAQEEGIASQLLLIGGGENWRTLYRPAVELNLDEDSELD